MSSTELDELLELLDCAEDDEELLSAVEELLGCSVVDEAVVLDELLDCAEDDEEPLSAVEELLDCTEELESSPHAVSDKTIAAVKIAPKIFCPFFIFYPFRLLVYETNCSFTIIYTHTYIVKSFLEFFVFF